MDDYESEARLVERFLNLLASGDHPWDGEYLAAKEFNYIRGKTDVIAVDESGQVLAFEAKLTRWKEALHQAYRNTCFAHRSYVLLPEARVPAALRFLSRFERLGIGLCAVGVEGLTVIQESKSGNPLQPLLSRAAAEAAREHTILS